ncbi:SDR family NAD(P)-dependent oxidoreductase [Bacillus sp. AK128]
MKKVLVLGATGGMGYALVKELASRGIETIAFSRNEDKLNRLFDGMNQVRIHVGNVLIEQEVMKAAEGVEVIFNAISFPYQEWAEHHPLCMENIIKAAQVHHCKVAHVDNIYAYGSQPSILIGEETHKEPHTKKGKLRLQLETQLKESSLPYLIVHFPDLYGPNAESTILHETLKHIVLNKKARFVGKPDVAREFLYTLDGAKAMVELAIRDDAYHQNWNIPATHSITGEELFNMIRKLTGYQLKISIVTKNMLRFVALFSPFMREFLEMTYLQESPVLLCGDKYEQKIGILPRTPYEEGLKETLDWMKLKSFS